MASGQIKLKLKGFDDMLEKIKEAGKDADATARKVIEESAKIVETELKTAAAAAQVKSSITDEIKRTVEKEGDRYSAAVGWEVGNYDPRNVTAGYIAIFENYGTVRRQTRTGKDRGELKPRNFISTAKKAAKPKVKKLQKQIIDEVMGDLK